MDNPNAGQSASLPPSDAIPARAEHGYVAPDYLRATAALAADCKLRSYAQMRMQPGQRVLDVGCGIGIDVLAMARHVGRSGMATGADADPRMVQQARQNASVAGIAHVGFELATAMALPWASASFDSLRSERMFQHLTDPQAALAEMLRVTRPGGRVVILDTDWGSLSIHSPDAALERRLVAFKAQQALRNGFSGRRLLALMQAAGLVELGLDVLPLYSTDYATARMACDLDDLSAHACAAGIASRQEIDAFDAAMHGLDRAHGFFASVNMVLVAGTRSCA